MNKRTVFVLAAILASACIASAQIGTITTYAGGGTAFPGNGGPATSANISNPSGLAVDGNGNLYIAASGESLILQVNPSTGIITTFAGGGTGGDGGLATAALLSGPCGVAVDSSGNVYFSETCVVASGGGGGGSGGGGTSGTARIRRVDAVTGIITTVAGAASFGAGFAGDGGPATNALLNFPEGLAIDAAGDIFVADAGNNRIRRIDAVTGYISTVAGNGSAAYAGDGGPAVSASLNAPAGLTVDANGNLYVADTGNNVIRRVDGVSGVITTVAGTGVNTFNGDAIPATAANLYAPGTVVLNSSGNLVISEVGNNRVRTIDNSGLIWTLAGDGSTTSGSQIGNNGPASLALLDNPLGLAYLPAGQLLIAELTGNRVRLDTLTSPVAATATTVSSTATSFAQGAAVTLTATLAATNGMPYNAAGMVYFFDGTSFIGGVAIVNGSAPLTTSSLALGVHHISAEYAGGTGFGGSFSPIFTLTIAVPPPTVSLTANPNPAAANQSVSLTAIVSPSAATGTVAFYNGATSLGSATLSGGVAVLTAPGLAAGAYTLTAQYSGDGSHAGATSPALALTVKATSSVIVTSSANPSNSGQMVVFTATVTPATATGSVQFLDGTTQIGTGTISSGTATLLTSSLAAGQRSITASYLGDANDAASVSPAITQTVLAATTVSVASSQNPVQVGAPVTFFAALTPTSATGSVQFFDGTTSLGTATLAGGSASLATSSLSQGTHSITAVYGGDSNNAGSTSAALSQAVKLVTGLSLVSSVNPSVVGQSVAFTVTLNPAATGTVQFLDSSTVLSTVAVASGVAAFSTSNLALGSHSISVVYSGDSNYMSAGSAAMTQTVRNATAVSLSISVPNPAPNQSVTLTATVTPSTATGTVVFLDGGANIGSGILVSGSQYISITLAQGSHSLTAVYSGDANNATSTSAVLSVVVKTVTTTAVTSSVNPSIVGASVTFAAAVTPATATGTVQFLDGASVLATATLSGGSASFSSAALAVGTHSITAVYSGDANNTTSTSGALSQVVNKQNTTATITSSANPSAYGQSVTFTATMTPSTATGTVTFSGIGTATLSSGVASITTSSLAAGTTTVTAQYGGDANNNPSTSTGLAQVVNKVNTTTAIASSLNPSIQGQSVTFTATVTPATATGTVTFSGIGTATLSGGMASITTSSLAVGTTAVTAQYSGDSNHNTSTSTALGQVVKTATTTTVTSSVNPSTVGQSVTFTAQVSPSAATGSVQFLDGATVLATVTLSSGRAAYTATSLAQGAHSITASYGGSTSYGASTSAVLTQTVNVAAPAAPSNLTATAAGTSQINLAWTASATSGVTYDVYQSTTSGFTPSTSNLVASGVTSTSYSATGLTASTTYYFKVTAVNSGGASAATSQASATTTGVTACHVVYSVTSDWGTGFGTAISIQNTGTSTISDWTLSWAWAGNQKITQSWNANYSQTGANAQLTYMSYDATIAPGATLSGMGFNASYKGTNQAPTTFYVNGTLCH